MRHWSALLDETWRKRNAAVAAETRADKVLVVAKMVATTTENHADHDDDVAAVVAEEGTTEMVAANQQISQVTHR
jgi:hypothetical protein